MRRAHILHLACSLILLMLCLGPARALRSTNSGWIVVQVAGEPYQRGYAFAMDTAAEYVAYYDALAFFTYETTGKSMEYFVSVANQLHAHKIPAEFLAEMQGYADGVSAAASGRNVSLAEIIGVNAWMEITGYWWPLNSPAPTRSFRAVGAHCSAFAAAGSATADGGIVIGHTTFMDFVPGQFWNVLLDLTPSSGQRIVMQTAPGLIASMTDFFVTGAGLIVSETTIVNFAGYRDSGMPEYVRARNASQYATTIEEWVAAFALDNNGGYANSWLLGDVKTSTIAEYESGLLYSRLLTRTDGFFYGDNVADSAEIRNLECSDTGSNDIRQSTGARRARWPQLLRQHEGNISADTGMTMLADTYDVYYNKANHPSSRTICAHFDADDQAHASDSALFDVPFLPMGSIDGKVASSAMFANANGPALAARWGRADGVEFDADAFLAAHVQFSWQAGYLNSRPSQPWIEYP